MSEEALKALDEMPGGEYTKEGVIRWFSYHRETIRTALKLKTARQLEPFIVKHYSDDARPTIKGNGFDGIEVGEDREEAEGFIKFINQAIKD